MSDKEKILTAQKYMYENITGFDYEKSPHLIKLLQILGDYNPPKCKPLTEYPNGDAQ